MADYEIKNTDQIITPALLLFRDVVQDNVRKMIEIAGDAARLRPHCKTHKMSQVIQLQLEHGVVKHKCATFAEAEMAARAGARDIFLAYNLVGPNLERAVRFAEQFPDTTFSVTADDSRPLQQLESIMSSAGRQIDVLVDIDIGMHRTGLGGGQKAHELYEQIVQCQAIRPGGIHAYDGHNHQVAIEERTAAVMGGWQAVKELADSFRGRDWPVPRIVVAGTGSFPVWAKIDEPALELSPGTCVIHDAGYYNNFPDLNFEPAALLLTRVISRPAANRVTFDLGYKACASDPPLERRLVFPSVQDARIVLQNEEHLVIETDDAENFSPGDEILAIPWHICPTSALHRQAYVVQNGQCVDTWAVVARDRQLTI